MSKLRTFLVVAPGLEQLARAEARALGIPTRSRAVRGGVEAELTARQLYLLHRHGRIPTRVLVRLASAQLRRFDELEALVAGIDWAPYLPESAAVDVRATSVGSSLYHEGAVVERVLRALARPQADDGARVQIRIDHDRATVSIDATGEPLHRRGWRTATHAAPLRATLAAAMLRAAGYDGSVPLVDPMTGSGTIAIEAASVALALPIDRPFAFQRWPAFEPGTWASASVARPTAGDPAPVLAADRDAGAVRAATEHVVAAGVERLVQVEHAALRAQAWPSGPALVVCNPPYGQRVSGRDLRDLYAALGARVREGGHLLCLLAADDRLVHATGLELTESFATTNGGIPVRCWTSPT